MSILRLKSFGTPHVEHEGRPVSGAGRQRRVLALLSIVAVARERGVSRDRVLSLLWSESEPEKARQALTQTLYHTRRALDEDELFLAAADLRLNPGVIVSDVWEFEDALDRAEFECAMDLYEAPFLDGFYVNGAPEFERWASDERARLSRRCADTLDRLATKAEAAADPSAAVEWCRRRAALEPLNTRAALRLMRALATLGDRAGALQYAREYEALLRRELDVAPDAELTTLAERLRVEAGVGDRISRVAAPNAGTVDARAEVNPSFEPSTATRHAPLARWHGLGRRPAALLGFAAVVAAVSIAGVVALRRPRPSPVLDTIVVAPFRVSGADPALAYLRDGMVDLLVTKLTENDATQAPDAGAVIAMWRRAGFTEGKEPSRDAAFGVVRQLGGRRLMLGSVVGTPAHLVISASVLGAPDTALRAQASVEGPSDSLTTLVDRLVARLLARESGAWERLANHTSTSVSALRAYLEGQAADRRGSHREAMQHFRNALAVDPNFAMAGLGLALAADRVDERDDRARGLAAAWESRFELTERDQVFLQALLGPRYPEASPPREMLAALDRAAALMPDRADVWSELGERLFYEGQLLGIPDWEMRAAAAFRRAAQLDQVFASPLQFLVQLAAAGGDRGEVRRSADSYLRVDSAGDFAQFVRWRTAVALGDSTRVRALRLRFATMPVASLRAVVLTSQYYGIAMDDGAGALAALRTRAVRASDRADLLLAEHAIALNAGDKERAEGLTSEFEDLFQQSPLPLQLRVLDALYGGGDSLAAARSVKLLRTRSGRVLSMMTVARRSRTAVPSAEESRDLCVAGQWEAWHHRESDANRIATALSSATVDESDALAPVCGALIAAISSVQTHARDAGTRVARVDSLVAFGPPAEALRGYANLALSRLYSELHNARRALTVARRRVNMLEWPLYLSAQLREESRLAAIVGDSIGAATANRHALALRAEPKTDSKSVVVQARSRFQRFRRLLAR